MRLAWPETAPVLVLAALLTLAIHLVLTWLSGVARSRTARVRVLRAQAGETRARRLLESAGYAVVGAQVSADHEVIVDGASVRATIRADFLLERDGRRFVAEVKTGAQAPRITTIATRRQLLEYLVAFEVDGVLLVDAESERVHAISFPRLLSNQPEASRPTWAALVVAVVITALLVGCAANWPVAWR